MKKLYLNIFNNYLNEAGSFITCAKWNSNQGINIYIQQIAYENVVCNVAAMLSWHQ